MAVAVSRAACTPFTVHLQRHYVLRMYHRCWHVPISCHVMVVICTHVLFHPMCYVYSLHFTPNCTRFALLGRWYLFICICYSDITNMSWRGNTRCKHGICTGKKNVLDYKRARCKWMPACMSLDEFWAVRAVQNFNRVTHCHHPLCVKFMHTFWNINDDAGRRVEFNHFRGLKCLNSWTSGDLS